MLKRAIVLSLGFVLACSGSPNDENDGDDGAELSSKACSGAACASLTAPKPLLRGGVAAVGSELYWIGLGPNGADGQPTDELQHCTLPACSSVTKLPLVLPNGKSLRATQLHALGGAGGVFFLGDEPGEFYDGFYTSDGASFQKVYSGYENQHQRYAVDDAGLAVYIADRRTDGWARSTLKNCPWNGLALGQCTAVSDSKLNHILDIAVTPTRVIATRGTGVYGYDRATLKTMTGVGLSGDGGVSLYTIGETEFGATVSISSHGNKAVHDTAFWIGPKGPNGERYGATVSGVLTATTSTATSLYVGTIGEGDVWNVDGVGVVARVSPKGTTSVLAKAQDAHGIAVGPTKTYWVNGVFSGDDGNDIGVIRSAKK